MSVQKKEVFINLPFKGYNISLLIKKGLSFAVERAFYSAKLIDIEETTRAPFFPRKDLVDLTAKSNVIYGSTCNCGCSHICRTSSQLVIRTNGHIPKWLTLNKSGTAQSAITRHLEESGHRVDSSKAFRKIYTSESKLKLRFSEAVSIRIMNPILCVKMQVVNKLSLSW